MRNYDNEIKELLEDIEELKITRKSKETQLKLVREDQRESIKNKKITVLTNDITRDHFGKPIFIGDWVNVTTKGKFNNTEGEVLNIKKWVTFRDRSGNKQCRAPYNLILSDTPTYDHDTGRKSRSRNTNATGDGN